MTHPIPDEAGWDSAPSLLDGAMTLELTAQTCDLRYWLAAVPQGTLRGQVLGHAPEVQAPDFMREPGPLRDALSQELAFRSIAEEKATRAISYLVAAAPDNDTMEFFATQLLDEARHAMVFRSHLLQLGVPEDELWDTIEKLAGDDRDRILTPLEQLGLEVLRDNGDFLGGVVVLTILVEGVLAPAAELSERKWRPLDPAVADIERGAGIDEIRHLTVGSSIAREHLLRHPGDKAAVGALLERGSALWATLPTQEQIYRRELLFQEGLRQHADVVGDYEIWPGRRMVDTTPEERMQTAFEWSRTMQRSRLEYMGLAEVVG
ncbi:MAG: VlmB-like protein [Actinobacteria bacterium]|nr:VlmB-like protein [Actinomycetota bacterium]MBI3688544.1 VlmB-like protein [Actinomycetota bacterium]